MTDLRNVTGTWRGTYSYNASDHVTAHTPVRFTLILKQGWFGRFTGTVTEDGTGSMPGTGYVLGRFSFPQLEFTKLMPVCYITQPDGTFSSLRDHLAKLGHTCEKDLPHHPVVYRGQFSDSTHVHGSWIIRGGLLPIGNEKVLEIPETEGNWSMEAV